jgi:hypothetical protein
MHRYYCSYFDKNYLLKGLALMASLNRHCKNDFTLYAFCLDELTRTIVEKLAIPNVVAVPLHKLEEHDQELLAAKKTRSNVEYYWTLTPSIMLWLLDRHPEIDLVTYLDADLYFYADPEPIFEELGENSVLIHGHRFPEHMRHLEIYGKYNVGLLCFRRDANGLATLKWWRERCNEWCYCELEDGKYGDQLYLDEWPERFPGVHVLQHIGAGVAPWNHIQYRFRTKGDGTVWLDDRPVIFYHFHSLDFVRPGVVVPAKFMIYPLREDIVVNAIFPYVLELRRALEMVRALLADFSFGVMNDQLLTVEHTFIAEKGYRDELRQLGLEHPTIELSAEWECHCSAQMSPPAPPYEEAPAPLTAASGGAGVAVQVKPDKPTLSVVIPSYNYGRYIGACLDSILSQNYPNLELIVVDGGSSDDSVEIIRKHERHISYWRSHPDAGNYAAIEEGLNRSSGEIMTWLNADDMYHPGAFETVASIFSAEREVEWLMGRPNSFDEQGRQKHVLSFLPMNSRAKYLAGDELIQQEGTFWRRGLWERSGACIDKELKLAADLELWARFFRSARLFSVDTLLAGFRDHPLQKSKDKAGYTAEANLLLARERQIFAAESTPFNPPAPLPILIGSRPLTAAGPARAGRSSMDVAV